MRTELTNTPLGHVLEATPARITFEVEGDAADGFGPGDEVMLIRRLTASDCEPYRRVVPDTFKAPPGWMTARQYADHAGVHYRTVMRRVKAGTVEACRMPSPSGLLLRWLVRRPA